MKSHMRTGQELGNGLVKSLSDPVLFVSNMAIQGKAGISGRMKVDLAVQPGLHGFETFFDNRQGFIGIASQQFLAIKEAKPNQFLLAFAIENVDIFLPQFRIASILPSNRV